MCKKGLCLLLCLCLLAGFAVMASAAGEAELPEIGVFSQPEYREEYWLENGIINYIPGEGAVVYVMAQNGFDETPTSIVWYPDAFTGKPYALGGGKYALKITVPATMAHDYGYWLPVDGGGVMLNLNDLTTAVRDDVVMLLECDENGVPLQDADPTTCIDHGLAGTCYYQIVSDAADISAAACTFVPYEFAVQRGVQVENLGGGRLKLTFPNRFGGGIGGIYQGEMKLTEVVFETAQWCQTEVPIGNQSYTLTFGTGDNGSYFDRGPRGSAAEPSEVPVGVVLQDAQGNPVKDVITDVTFSVERDCSKIASVLQQPQKQQNDCWDGRIKLADKLGDAYIYAHITLKLSVTAEKTVSLRMYALVTEDNGQGGNQGGNQEPQPVFLLECDEYGVPAADAVRTSVIDHGYKTTRHYLVFENMQTMTAMTGYEAISQNNLDRVEVLPNGVLKLSLDTQFDNGRRLFIRQRNGTEQAAMIRRDHQDHVPVTIGGKEYTLLFGACRGEDVYQSWWLGDAIMGPIADRGYTTADRGVILYENYGDVENMKVAPPEIQKKITNVVFTERYDEKNMLSVTQPAVQTDGGWWNGMYRIEATPGDAHAVAVVTIDGMEEPIRLWEYARMVPVEVETVQCDPDMTIEDVSAMISNRFPEIRQAGKAMRVELAPGKVYTGDLTVKIKDWEPQPYNELPITISGTFDQTGKPSTIVGSLVLHHGFNLVENIHFKAPANAAGETVGVIHEQAEAARIERCIFEGYDVAIDGTADGFSGPNEQNLFLHNGIAVRINCPDKTWGHQRVGIMNSVFIDNDVAVQIVQMPDHSPQYSFRIMRCDFVENGRDFVVEGGKNFYFHDNFYGNSIQQGQYVTDRAAHVKGKVNTGFRWRNPVSMYWAEDTVWWQPVLEEYGVQVKKEKTAQAENERLLTSAMVENVPVYSTAVPNDDTDELLVSGGNIEAGMAVEVTDGQDTVLGVWQFS